MAGTPAELTPLWEKAGALAILAGLLALAVLFAWRPLAEPDFWWHLKTGELIAANKGLLPGDPFNFTSNPQPATLRERVILDGYWLWQVVAYGFYRACDFTGIKLLNLFTVAGILAAAGWSLRRSQVRAALALPLLALGLVCLGAFFQFERPQLASFLAMTVLVGLMVAVRRGERPSRWLYPLMAVWGNLHGGVIFGAGLLGLFALGSLWDCRADRPRLKGVLIWCAFGLGASLLNPNGISVYLMALNYVGAGMTELVGEYQSTFAALRGDKTVLLVFGVLMAHFLALWRVAGRSCLADWLVSLAVAAMALWYARNIPFAAVALMPMTGYYLERALVSCGAGLQRLWHKVYLLTAGAFLLYVAIFAREAVDGYRRGEWGEVSRETPRDMADFLATASLQGRMLNEYTIGGYLLWALYPQYQVFTDGRGLDNQVVLDQMKMLAVSLLESDGRPEYEVLLDKYAINLVVVPFSTGATGLNPLLKYLLLKPEWQPVYLGADGYVLLKNDGRNRAFLERGAIDKRRFLDDLIALYGSAVRRNPGDYRHYFGRGELLGYIGRYDEAARDFAMVAQLDPGNEFLPSKIKQLESLRQQARSR